MYNKTVYEQNLFGPLYLEMPFYHQNDNESSWTAIHHFALYPSSLLRANTFGENPVHIAISQIFCLSINKEEVFLVREMLITKLGFFEKSDKKGKKQNKGHRIQEPESFGVYDFRLSIDYFCPHIC